MIALHYFIYASYSLELRDESFDSSYLINYQIFNLDRLTQLNIFLLLLIVII